MPTRFQTLLLREWMQHKRGWLITLLAPPLIFLVLLLFGGVHSDSSTPPMGVALSVVLISTGVLFGISWLSAMFQLPGLARRDVQDRSIEFWLSLPASHSESIGATVLAHVLLVPLAAVLLGYLCGLALLPALFVKMQGLSGWQSIHWLTMLFASLPLLARALLGVTLLTLWLAPLMLIMMAASAWLKRGGVPVVGVGLGVGGLLLDKVYGTPIVWELLKAQQQGANHALLADPHQLIPLLVNFREGGADGASIAAWAWQDSLQAAQQLASPHFIGGLIVAAACFALLVLRRQRAG